MPFSLVEDGGKIGKNLVPLGFEPRTIPDCVHKVDVKGCLVIRSQMPERGERYTI